MEDWHAYDNACYIPGRPKAVCQRCGYEKRRDELRVEWTNLIVCPPCYDPRPPQLDAPVVYPEGLPIDRPSPEIEQSGPNTTTPNDL